MISEYSQRGHRLRVVRLEVRKGSASTLNPLQLGVPDYIYRITSMRTSWMIPVAASTRKTSQPTSITSYLRGMDREDRSASGGNRLAMPGGSGLPLSRFFRMPGRQCFAPRVGVGEIVCLDLVAVPNRKADLGCELDRNSAATVSPTPSTTPALGCGAVGGKKEEGERQAGGDNVLLQL